MLYIGIFKFSYRILFYLHDFQGKSFGLNEVSYVKISAYHGAGKNDPDSGHVQFLTTIHDTTTCAK